MVLKIDHIGIAVPSVEEAKKFVKDAFGLEMEEIEIVASQKVKVGRVRFENIILEFLEPTAPNSPISGFIEKRGGGLHHIAISVENVKGTLKSLKEKGVSLIDGEPRGGAAYKWIAFLSPKNPAKTLIELVETKGGIDEN